MAPSYPPEVRLSAGFAVAHFAQLLAANHEDVAAYIAGETDEAQLENLILCFGMLGRFSEPKPNTSILVAFLQESQTQTLRIVSAVALTTILGANTPDAALQTILAALSESWAPASCRENWQWWNEGDLLGYAALALRLAGDNRKADVARALCAALTSTDACTFAIPQTLLDILFPDPKPEGGWQVNEFDEVQRTSLATLLRTEHWKDWMIDSRFLPAGLTGKDYSSALDQFVSDVTGERHGQRNDLGTRAGNVSAWDTKKNWP